MYRALLAANYVSWLGNGITIVAVPLYVLARTGSTMAASFAGAANALPLIISGVAGGVLVDRWGARRTSILADTLAGLCTVGVPLADRLGSAPLTVILGLLFLRSLFNAPGNVARLTLLPLAAEAAGVRKQTANTLYQLAPRVALMVGPALAGIAVSLLGPATTLVLDAMTFVTSAAVVAAFVRPARRSRGDKPGSSFAAEIRSGLGFVRASRGLATMLLIISAMNFIDEAFIPVLLPVYSRDVLSDPRLVGWLLGANGIGAVLGTVLYLILGARLAALQWATFMVCLAVVAAMRLGLAGLPDLAGASVMLFIFGVASGPLNPIINTIVQEVTPPALRGRVFGIMSATAYAAAPIGIMAGGWVVAGWGLRAGLTVFGALYAVVFAVAWSSGSLRQLADRHARLLA